MSKTNTRTDRQHANAMRRAAELTEQLRTYLESLGVSERDGFMAAVNAPDAVQRIAFVKDTGKRRMMLLALAVKRQAIKMADESNPTP